MMICIAPFMMLSLRDSIKKERTAENTEALRKLILDDIMNLIESSRTEGDITSADAIRMQSLVHHMYLHLYSHYSEFQKGGLNAMMNDGLVLDCDIWERDITKKLTKEITEELTEQITEALTEQITEELTEQITEQSLSDTVQKLYTKLGDAAQVADLLDLSTERVLELL